MTCWPKKNVPNVDSALNLFEDDEVHGSVAYLQPKGVNRVPTSHLEVREAVLCVLDALVFMHRAPNALLHRDIRWPNVILSARDPTKWFLIDWDEATTTPTSAATHLAHNYHAPAVFKANHGAEVDIWGVGKLILDAREFLPDVSGIMMDIGREMVEGLIGTAKQAQARILQTVT